MTYETFHELQPMLHPFIIKSTGYTDDSATFYCHNGKISTSVRLACAIRYFAGGSPYDIMVKFGVSHSVIFESIWIVVNAIDKHPNLVFKYPESFEEQKNCNRIQM